MPEVVGVTSCSRDATHRARYLERAHGLREPVAITLALAEEGYSSSGIANRVGVETTTIRGYNDRLVAEFGLEPLEVVTTASATERPQLNCITPDRIQAYATADRESGRVFGEDKTRLGDWLAHAERAPEYVPDGVLDVGREAATKLGEENNGYGGGRA